MSTRSGNRRDALRLGCRQCLGLAGLLGGAASMAQTGTAPVQARLARPPIESDEGGLWALMDREETRLRRSPFVVPYKELAQYVQALACRLGGEHCADIRVHVVRTPLFNASMAPNGMMQVWTGLLLRVENEAQLAAVLGHEIAHYLERHSVDQLRDAKSRTAAAQFIGLFGAIGALGSLGMLAGSMAFTREHETRADRLGMQLMLKAGYDGTEAARVWENLLGEIKVTGGADAGTRSPMMATHPPVENRRSELLKMAGSGGEKGVAEFQKTTARYRFDWLLDEIKRGQFEESLVLFDRLLKSQPTDPQLLFSRGEVYRLRAREDDLERSLADLTLAAQQADAPAQTQRSLGYVYQKRDDAPASVQAFSHYLAAAPDAPDAALIKTYISK